MTRLYAIRLLERVGLTFLLAFAGTYVTDVLALGRSVPQLATLTDLSLAHKALAAGLAAVIQLVLSTLVAPHVGDPSTPDLLPARLLKRLGGAVSSASGGAVAPAALTAVVDGTVARLKARYGSDAPVTVESVAAEIAAQYQADKARGA